MTFACNAVPPVDEHPTRRQRSEAGNCSGDIFCGFIEGIPVVPPYAFESHHDFMIRKIIPPVCRRIDNYLVTLFIKKCVVIFVTRDSGRWTGSCCRLFSVLFLIGAGKWVVPIEGQNEGRDFKGRDEVTLAGPCITIQGWCLSSLLIWHYP